MRRVLAKLLATVKLVALATAAIALFRLVKGSRRAPVLGEANWPPLDTDPPSAGAPATTAATADTSRSATDGGTADGPPSTEATWVEPVAGECPASHPVKGNADSGIYHVPGGAFYDRTVAERCYESPEAAEADGYRAAKR